MTQSRHATPGVGLILSPPKRDTYSVESSARLIGGLNNTNLNVEMSVKPASGVGVDVMAAAVARAKTDGDHMAVSGHDGGTGVAVSLERQEPGYSSNIKHCQQLPTYTLFFNVISLPFPSQAKEAESGNGRFYLLRES